jgi:hypothetical protein
MEGYAGKGLNGYTYLTKSPDGQVFTVVGIAEVRGERIVHTGLVVRLADNRVIIEHDANDKQLVDALMQAGISRSQIVLAYAGESVEEAA